MTDDSTTQMEPELIAMSTVYTALRTLEPDVQQRILNWVAAKLNIDSPKRELEVHRRNDDQNSPGLEESADAESEDSAGVLDGVSPVARKWITRNRLQPERLATIFSLGGEEIDLIANTVPGIKKKERMHSVFLLKGVAAYLGTGAPRFTHEQMKEACLHYDAFDASNFAVYLKSFSGEVSGNKESGYALTPRGLANATEIVKSLLQA